MKKNNIWRMLWVGSVFIVLIIIYKLVIIYKVEWETRDFNTYLYFYNCGDTVCSSTTKPKATYKKIVCIDDVCPYITNISNDILVLNKDNTSWLYDYKKGEVYHDKYTQYKMFQDNLYLVTDANGKQGLMNENGEILINNRYNEIVDYKDGMIVYKDKNLYGIDYVSGDQIMAPRYKNVMIINNTLYAAILNDKYQIYGVVNNALKNSEKYDYIWSNDDVIIVVRDNQLDILSHSLESNLLMKIRTYLSYSTKNEIAKLNLHYDDNYIYFNINTNSTNYIEYKYDIANKKISSNN